MMAMILILYYLKRVHTIFTWFIYMKIHKEKEKKNKKSQIGATFKCLLSCPFKSEAMVSGPKDT